MAIQQRLRGLPEKVDLPFFSDVEVGPQATQIQFGVELIGDGILLGAHQVGEKAHAAQKTGGGDQGYIALTIAVDRWQIVGDARQYFVPVKVQAVSDPLKLQGTSIGVDDVKADFESWRDAVGGQGPDGTDVHAGCFVFGVKCGTACNHPDR